jgi:hypothetical protein
MTDQTREPSADDVRPVANRREFIRNGVVGVASISFAAMLARREAGAASCRIRMTTARSLRSTISPPACR